MSVLGEALVGLRKLADAALAQEQKKGNVPKFTPLSAVKGIDKESSTWAFSVVSKISMVDELIKLNAVTSEQARESLTRLERLEGFKPTVKQVGRYATLGAVAAPTISAIGSTLRGKPYIGVKNLREAARGGVRNLAREAAKPEGALRTIASDAARGAIGSGLIPIARTQLDIGGEMGTLKKFMKEIPPEVISASLDT